MPPLNILGGGGRLPPLPPPPPPPPPVPPPLITTDHLPYGCHGNAVADLSVGVALRGPGSDTAWLPPQWLPHAGLTMPGWGAHVDSPDWHRSPLSLCECVMSGCVMSVCVCDECVCDECVCDECV